MLKFIFSFFLVLCSLSSIAQVDSTAAVNLYTKSYGLRVGTDLNKLARNFYEDKYKGFEVVGDYRISENLYIATELGMEEKYTDSDQFDFTTNGQYIKLGIDYNVYENWLDMDNMLYVGGRIGYSYFNQNLHEYTVRDLNNYFPSNTNFPEQKFKNLSAFWLEFVAGIKVEMFSNFYLGASARLNYRISDTEVDNFENLHITGFNKKYSGDFGVGLNYTISYIIPLFKK